VTVPADLSHPRQAAQRLVKAQICREQRSASDEERFGGEYHRGMSLFRKGEIAMTVTIPAAADTASRCGAERSGLAARSGTAGPLQHGICPRAVVEQPAVHPGIVHTNDGVGLKLRTSKAPTRKTAINRTLASLSARTEWSKGGSG
jgi:hypothetical protein